LHLVLGAAQPGSLVGLDQRPLDEGRLGRHGCEHCRILGIGQTAIFGVCAANAQPLLWRNFSVTIELGEYRILDYARSLPSCSRSPFDMHRSLAAIAVQ
jgi:hypothetical protein